LFGVRSNKVWDEVDVGDRLKLLIGGKVKGKRKRSGEHEQFWVY
jgi:hypothetical protein